jgi:hypothetical protein
VGLCLGLPFGLLSGLLPSLWPDLQPGVWLIWRLLLPHGEGVSSTLNCRNPQMVRHGLGAICSMSTFPEDSSQSRDLRSSPRVEATSSRRISVTVSQRAWQYLVERSAAEGRSLSNLASFLLESAVPDQ